MKIKLCILLALFNTSFLIAQIFTDNLIVHIPIQATEVVEIQNNLEVNLAGTINVEDRFGNEQSALSFDGINDSLEIDNEEVFQCFGNMISISVWIRLKDSMVGAENFVLLSNLKKEVPQQTYYVGFGSIINSENKVEFAYANQNSGFAIKDLSNILFDQNWHHLVGIFDQVNFEFKFYIDNVLISSIIPPNLLSFSDLRYMNIGGSISPQIYANIEVDDLRIYNRTISECEILNLFNENIQEISCEEPIFEDCEFITSNFNVQNNSSDIDIFPNPAKKIVYIKLKGAPTSKLWVLQNNIGQIINQGVFIGELNEINLNSVPNGIYFLRVSDSISKIVIQK